MARWKLFIVPVIAGVIVGFFSYALGQSALASFNLGMAALVGGLFTKLAGDL